MSLETLRADSVLWPALKPDWNLSNRECFPVSFAGVTLNSTGANPDVCAYQLL